MKLCINRHRGYNLHKISQRRTHKVKNALMKLIYFLAEKGKLIGINRGKLKALLYPAYRFFCYVVYTMGGVSVSLPY